MTLTILLLAVVCLAWANGANDNFKGVATLFGSGTANYRGALLWAAATTFLGSLTAVFLAGQLLRNFSGRGLVEGGLVADPHYVAAVALGAALTVLLATRIGMPISTTHSLVGALVGAGWAAGSVINGPKLLADFFAPLLFAPLLAIAAAVTCYPALRAVRRLSGVTEETCICISGETVEVIPQGIGGDLSPPDGTAVLLRIEQISIEYGTTATCHRQYGGRVFGIDAATLLDRLHYLSAGVVSFARGLNDTPKIAALLLAAPAVGGFGGTALVGIAMAAGGLLGARRVAEVMSHRITAMNHGQGFSANLVTGLIVIGASRLGLPVSTTHVSCGALFGIGSVTGQARWGTIAKILSAWITTLPLATALGAAAFWMLRPL